ncbi:hypothetical protein [Ruania zhangjianzhongii]|uniref:hypothetical protein n=1 Tax=Ruania zhangjianzhongii TaxID=2603206 RepID=UPI0011C8C389|nr:hypothetical protein [Ruania zhangjianzhongii]
MKTTTPVPRRAGRDRAPSVRLTTDRRGRLPALVAGAWSLAYAVLGIVWAFGGPGYPFAGQSTLIPATSLLDQTTALVSGLTIAGIAVGMGILTLRLVRGHTDRATAVLAVITGLVLAVVLTDVRILMTMGYLPVMLVALATGSIDGATIAAMANWPAVNLLLMMVAGVSLTVLGMRQVMARLHNVDPARALRVGRVAVAVAMVVPIGYATTRLGWLLGVPVGISEEFLATISEITPIGAGLGTLALIGAVLTLGLVQRWGEVWPRWVPVLRGREIPARGPAWAALAVAVPIAAAGLMYIRKVIAGVQIGPPGAETELGAWLPEMLWPIWAAALTVAALAYLLRRGHGLYFSGDSR